jgi:hypothetical protein
MTGITTSDTDYQKISVLIFAIFACAFTGIGIAYYPDNITGLHPYGNYTMFSPMSECFTYHVDNFTFYGRCLE